jgi:glucose-1-phosphate cytidylyltransferase
MQTIILCGGLGTRLREETEFRPKPMVHVGPRPIIWHIMKIYSRYGHKEFILPLGYRGEMFREYFYNYEVMSCDVTISLGAKNGSKQKLCLHNAHDESDWQITLVDTGSRSLKGSRIKQVEKYINDDPFFVTYGDGVSDIKLDELVKFHKNHGKIATLTGVSPAARFGELKVDGNQVVSFREKPVATSQEGLINGGFFVFNRRIFDYLSQDENCELESEVLEKLAQEGQLMVYPHKGFWTCMDTIRDVEYLNGLWDQGRAEWKIW